MWRQTALLAALTAAALLPARAGAAATAQAQTVSRFVSSVNTHRLDRVAGAFTPSAVLTVEGHRVSRRPAIRTWWHNQFAHRVHLALASHLRTRGQTVDAVVRRTTHRGDCGHGCTEQARWTFSGGRVRSLVLSRLKTPATPRPPKLPTVPPPPRNPPPRVTPTIPT